MDGRRFEHREALTLCIIAGWKGARFVEIDQIGKRARPASPQFAGLLEAGLVARPVDTKGRPLERALMVTPEGRLALNRAYKDGKADLARLRGRKVSEAEAQVLDTIAANLDRWYIDATNEARSAFAVTEPESMRGPSAVSVHNAQFNQQSDDEAGAGDPRPRRRTGYEEPDRGFDETEPEPTDAESRPPRPRPEPAKARPAPGQASPPRGGRSPRRS